METDRENVTLSPADAAAVDALFSGEARIAGAGGGGGDEQRQARAEGWLNVLGAAPVPEMRGDLAARTLAAVQADRMVLRPTENVGMPAGGGNGVREEGRAQAWARFRRRAGVIGSMGVAAMLLFMVAIEGLGTIKKSRARVACAGNLHNVALAYGNYCSAGGGELPTLAMPANQNWLYGTSETGAKNNAANLLPLVVGQYLPLTAFFCAGAGLPEAATVHTGHNEMPPISYSYRNLYGVDRPRWDRAHGSIVLADKNPVFVNTSHAGTEEHNSANHDGKGSYVVRADASVTWEISPNIGPDHDNIWTLGSGKDRQIVYKGTEIPASVKDVFVCP